MFVMFYCIQAANEKGNEDLSHWIASVRNHFWYCSRNCGGSATDFKVLVHTYFNYVTS